MTSVADANPAPARAPSFVSLRTRLALLSTGALVVAMLLFSLLVLQFFIRQQRASLENTLTRELTRVQSFVAESEVGGLLVAESPEDLTLQFVTPDGRVRIPTDAGAALPLADVPTLDANVDPPRLVGSVAWILPSGADVGTIRIALDLGDALAARASLVRSLVLGGIVVLVVFLAIQIVIVRRVLAPLRRLETATRGIDPAEPVVIPYTGPTDEVGRLADALNQALAGIREFQQRERDMLTEVSHELGGPLSIVVGQLEMLREDLEDDPRAETANDAHRAATELLHTTRDLITLARGDLEVDLMLEDVDLAEVARHVQRDYPEIACEAEPAWVAGDLRRLRQAIRNLVRNACEMGDASTVEVSVRSDDAAAVVRVRDTGPTFAREDLEHVYDRHFRLGRGAVSGIGLAVVKEIVEQHGGAVHADPAPEGGTVYTLRLPTLPHRT